MAKKISAEEFDKKIENGEDVSEYLQPASSTKTINIDLPLWLLGELDVEASRLNIARKALINIWLSDRLEANKRSRIDDDRKKNAG